MFLSRTNEMTATPGGRNSYADAARQAIASLGLEAVEMSRFPAAAESPADYCERAVRSCDLFILLQGMDYGTLVRGQGTNISYCELEYRAASTAGIPCLIFLLDELIAPEAQSPNANLSSDFRSRLLESGLMIARFKSPAQLSELVRNSILSLDDGEAAGHLAPMAPFHAWARAPWSVPATGVLTPRHSKEQELIQRLVGPEDQCVGVAASIEGAGGMGKTSLLAKVLRHESLRERYPGGLVWLTMGEECSSERVAVLIKRAIEQFSGLTPDTNDISVLSSTLGKVMDTLEPCLLVLDDVWDPEQLEPFLAGAPRARRLVTTRTASLVPPGSPIVFVDRMTVPEAVDTLRRSVPTLDEQSVRDLSHVTGRWPVLLGIVNGALCEADRTGDDVNELARWIVAQFPVQGPTLLDLRNASNRALAVEATMTASVRQLDPAIFDRYLSLALFVEDVEIPRDLLAAHWAQEDRTCTSLVASDTIATLARLRLAQERSTPTGRALVLHDIVRQYLRSFLGNAEVAVRTKRLLTSLVGGFQEAGGLTAESLVSAAERFGYLWEHLPWHLREASLPDVLADLATHPGWIIKRTHHLRTVEPVISDLESCGGGEAMLLAELLRSHEAHLAPLDTVADTAGAFHSRILDQSPLSVSLRRTAAQLLGPLFAQFVGKPPDDPARESALTLSRHRGRVWRARFVSGTHDVVTAADDGAVRIWRDGGTPQAMLEHAVAVRACGASPGGEFVLIGSRNGKVLRWEVAVDGGTRTLFRHNGEVTTCHVADDGSLALSAGADGRVRVWETRTWAEVVTIRVGGSGVRDARFNHSGDALVTSGGDGCVRIWSLPEGQLLNTLRGHRGVVTASAFLSDDKTIVSAGSDGIAIRWSTTTSTPDLVLAGHEAGINDLALAHNDAILATASADRTVRLWDLATGSEVAVLRGHLGGVNGCDINGDCTLIASASGDRTARIWEVRTQRTVTELPGESFGSNACSGFAGAHDFLTADSDAVGRVRSTEDGRELLEISSTAGWVTGCSLSRDGKLGVFTCSDGSVMSWDLERRTKIGQVVAHDGWARDAALFDWPHVGVLTVGDDGWVRSWTLPAMELRNEFHAASAWLLGCDIAPDCSRMAIATSSGDVIVLSLGDAWELAGVLSGHTSWARGCSFSPDGSRIATSSGDGSVRIWNALTCQFEVALRGHRDWVNGCSFDPSGHRVASVGRDRTLRVWDLSNGRCTLQVLTGSRLSGCTWLSGDRMALAGDSGVYLLELRSRA